jgi:UDP-glucose 4-epimerase
MMTLDDAVDLVLFAFENGNAGDIFVQKSPASTIEVLAKALIELYKSNSSIRIIGTRHGEKLYETLVNREEMLKAEDVGDFYRIPADTRDLNYNQFFIEGESQISQMEEYNSHNTSRLDIEETKQLLLKLDIIQEDLSKR